MFSPTWIAFTREGAIAGQSISFGLTSLRSANYAATGLYSSAFFNLSIGFERLLKLIFLIDCAVVSGGKYPTDEDLRKRFGHDLRLMFNHARAVHARLPNPEGRYELELGGLEDNILDFLARFAMSTRYYNLDFLTGRNVNSKATDPVAEWFGGVGEKILAKHYSERRQKKDAANAAIIETAIGPYAYVLHTAEDGSPLTSMEAGALQTSKNIILQKYGTFYCAKIARFLYMILYELNHEAHTARLDIPYLCELFFPFMNDDGYLLSRKTFPPRGQGR